MVEQNILGIHEMKINMTNLIFLTSRIFHVVRNDMIERIIDCGTYIITCHTYYKIATFLNEASTVSRNS